MSAPEFLGRADWRLGLGTYQLGVETERTVKAALRLGYRHIDTAALYRNEAAVTSAIKASGVKRNDICIATKIHIHDIDRLAIRTATEAALACLGEIDVLMLHAWRPNAPEAWSMLADEVRAGRVQQIGVSNFGADDLAKLASPAPCVNQIELSPFLPRVELRERCEKKHIAVAAHSPLAKARRLEEVRDVTGQFSATQVMLAWGLEAAAVVLPRSSDETHLKENIAALEIQLNTEQRTALQSLSDGYATHPKALR